jgi:hypothetical protein
MYSPCTSSTVATTVAMKNMMLSATRTESHSVQAQKSALSTLGFRLTEMYKTDLPTSDKTQGMFTLTTIRPITYAAALYKSLSRFRATIASFIDIHRNN